MEKNSAKKIIEQIKEQKVIPVPRWKLHLKSYIFWVLLIGLVLLSAAFLSLVILSVVDFDLELMRQLKLRNYVRLLMTSAPYIWIGMLILTTVLGFFIFRKTRRGYRYSILFIASIILLAVSVLGVGAHVMKMNDRIERAFADGPRGLHRLAPPGEERFFNPKEGIISGKIEDSQENIIIIKTFEDGLWEVSYDDKTRMKNNKLIEEKNVVIVIGREVGEKKFEAIGIKPMKRPGEGFVEKGEGKGPGPADGRAHRQIRK